MLVVVFERVRCCGWLNPPQLLLSAFFGVATVPWEPKAKVTAWPAPVVVRPEVQVSDAAPPTGHQGSPAPGDVPVRDIVPLKAEPVLLVIVTNPLSGLAQIVPLVLQTAPVAGTLPQGPGPQT